MMTKTIGMNQRLLLLAVCILWVVGSFPAPISYEQALTKATAFLTARNKQYGLRLVVDGTARLVPRKVRTTANQNAQPLYVFNIGEGNGFVILSGDDRTPSILGYSDKGSFDYATLPDNAWAWIDGYAEQITSLSDGEEESLSESVIYPVIAPMLTCTWDQQAPYNAGCPKFVTGTESVTGCIATAMAQVLYYYRAQSVDALLAEIPAYTCNTVWRRGQIKLQAIPAGTVIDWNNMLDTYSETATAEQKKAVSDLMRYCGAAVEMDYADQLNGGSKTSSWSIVGALGKYFGYSADIAHKERKLFTNQGWINLIYRELSKNRPVIISGMTRNKAGHAFICDGYDAHGLFHFNWGWGGMADGYYSMDNLKPTQQGIGGFGNDYNNDVVAIVGIHPDDGTNPYVERPCLTITEISALETYTLPRQSVYEGVRFNYKYLLKNFMTSTQSFETAIAWFKDSVRTGVKGMYSITDFHKSRELQPEGYFTFGNNLELGTYRLKTMSRLKDSTEWLEDNGSDQLYVEAKVKEKQITFKVVRPKENIELDEYGQEIVQPEDPIDDEDEDDPPQPMLTLTANSYIREYGDENPAFDFSVDGTITGLPSITCEATLQSPVGDYPIMISKGSVDYDSCQFVNGILTITKAPLKVAVKDVEREQGEENPQFELVYEGWKLQDTESVLIKKPVITTTATKDSPVGEYVIVVNGGESENYELSYQNGKLTVTVPSVIAMLLKSGRPFDVYDLSGRKVRHQVTTLKGLPSGAYIVNGKKVFI